LCERDVEHDGAGLAEFCSWLVEKTGAKSTEIAVAIEVPRGPVVEVLLERGFQVSHHPKQLEPFRDRSACRRPRTQPAMPWYWAFAATRPRKPFVALRSMIRW